MIKSITLAKRKPGITYEEYTQYWKEKHGPLAAKIIPGMRRYVQNHLIKLPGFEYEVDGIVEMWFDDIQAYQEYLAWRQSDEAKVLLDDVSKFADVTSRVTFIVEEHIMK